MNKVDSFTLSFPREYLTKCNLDLFKGQFDSPIGSTKASLMGMNLMGKKIIGLNKFYVPKDKDSQVKMEFSGKILGKEYWSLINKNNMDLPFLRVQKEGVASFNIPKILEEGTVHKLDITSNVKPPRGLDKTIQAFHLVDLARGYQCNSFDKTGLVLEKMGKDTRYRDRITLYSKYDELNLARNKVFCNEIGFKKVKEFEGVLRCERNIRTHKEIRGQFKVTKQSLKNILESKEEVSYNSLSKVVNSNQLVMDIDFVDDLTWGQYVDREGLFSIALKCNGDLEKMKYLCRLKGGNVTHQVPKFKQILKELGIARNLEEENSIVNEYLNLLRVA